MEFLRDLIEQLCAAAVAEGCSRESWTLVPGLEASGNNNTDVLVYRWVIVHARAVVSMRVHYVTEIL